MTLVDVCKSNTDKERLLIRIKLYKKMIKLEEDYIKRYKCKDIKKLTRLREMQKRHYKRLGRMK